MDAPGRPVQDNCSLCTGSESKLRRIWRRCVVRQSSLVELRRGSGESCYTANFFLTSSLFLKKSVGRSLVWKINLSWAYTY